MRIASTKISTGRTGRLRSLFRQLARLLPTLTNVIFVFDSQLGREQVSSIPEDLVGAFTEMIGTFGFHVHIVSNPRNS